MKHTTAAALLLAALTLSGTASLVSCGDSAADAEGTKAPVTEAPAVTEAETEELDALAARMKVDDGVPTVDFGGRNFHILGDDACTDYYTIAETTGDVLDDAVYERNNVVEDRFNIKLEATVYDEVTLPDQLKKTVMAGDDTYQLYAGHIIFSGMHVCDDIYYNWQDMPHIDFSKPWWAPSTVEDLTYAGKTFLAIGDFALSSIDSTYAMFFNKQIAMDNDLENLYDVVNEGRWTLDYFSELCKNLYQDVNGDGKPDEGDQYGMTIWTRSPINAFLWAFGEKVGKKQDDGTIKLDYFNDKVVDFYDKIIKLIWETPGVYSDSKQEPPREPNRPRFMNNQALFTPDCFNFASSALRDFETDYGILPMPKWDENQEIYYTMVDGGHEGLGIPLSIQDPEFVGTIVEVLNAESWKRTVPTYYDIVLKTKGARDEESVKILDMIFEGRVFDFGYVYGVGGPGFWPATMVDLKSSDIASFYEKNHKAFDKAMDKVFKYFEEYDLTK